MAELVGSEGSPLPLVAKSLSPYIKTRQDALRIRRILSVFLSSHIEGLPGKEFSITPLAVPDGNFQVKKIPSELSGLRRSYFKALQAHAKARKEYAHLTHSSLHDNSSMRQEERQDEEDSRKSIDTYLALTKEQRNFGKLRILQDYLELLSQKEAAQPDYLRLKSVLEGVATTRETLQIPPTLTKSSPVSDLDGRALTTRLEKAVLRAKNNLDNQKKSLAKIQQDQQGHGHGHKISEEGTASTGSKVEALSRTRDELIGWIEERLATSCEFNAATDELQTLGSKSEPLNIEKRRKEIQERYEDYLKARKSLVALLSSRDKFARHKKTFGGKSTEPLGQDPRVDSNWDEASSVLPYLTEYFIPNANAQKRFLWQESHLSSTLASQIKSTIQLLDRLAEESHLLPNYPVLASQPRFHKLVAAIGSKSSQPAFGGTKENEGEAQILSKARQWGFAASAASIAKQEAVKERLEHGNIQARIAEGIIGELQEILGVDGEGDEEDEGAEDIWTENIETKSKKQTSSGGRGGIWAGLDGTIGTETDRSRKLL